MRSIGKLILVIFILMFHSCSDVFICTGPFSEKYHLNENCRGLSNCRAEVKEINIDRAKNLNRTLCGIED